MSWSFHYKGPKKRTDDPDCLGCIAAVMKRCARKRTIVEAGVPEKHSELPDPSCNECRAAETSNCPSHCGIETALTSHEVTEKAEERFSAATAIILAECAAMPDGCTVEVTARGNDGAHERTPDGLEVKSHNLRNLFLDIRSHT